MWTRKLHFIQLSPELGLRRDCYSDAIIPAEFMPGIDNADLGSHCFQYYRPSFRDKAKQGSRIM